MIYRMKSRTSFDLHAGRLVLNFINTVEERPGYDTSAPAAPIELLDSPERLLAWCEASEAASKENLAGMRVKWRRSPKVATRSLTRFIALREGLFTFFLGRVQRGTFRECDVDFLNSELVKLAPRIIVKDTKGRLAWRWKDNGDAEEALIATLVSDAAELAVSDNLERVRVCAATDCGWLFLDTSKNGKRRWCDMADCGNREKQRRFQMNA